MFDSFLVALNAIMPTFLLLAFGYFLKHKNFVSSEFLKQTNTLTFKFFLPFLLFNNIYKTEITEAIDGMTFTIAVGSLLLLFAVLCVVVYFSLTKEDDGLTKAQRKELKAAKKAAAKGGK